MSIFTSIGGVRREVPELYAGAAGVTRQIAEGYAGVGGVLRQIYAQGAFAEFGKILEKTTDVILLNNYDGYTGTDTFDEKKIWGLNDGGSFTSNTSTRGLNKNLLGGMYFFNDDGSPEHGFGLPFVRGDTGKKEIYIDGTLAYEYEFTFEDLTYPNLGPYTLVRITVTSRRGKSTSYTGQNFALFFGG